MITAVDNFNRGNGNLDNSAFSGGTYIWDVVDGSFVIASNQADATDAGRNIAVLDPAQNVQDCYFQAQCVSGESKGICARYIDADNQYWADWTATATDRVRLFKRVGGGATELGSWNSADADVVIRLECDGIDPGTITVKVDGTIRISESGDAALDSGNLGLRCYTLNALLDNAEGGDLGAPAGLGIPIAMHHYEMMR